MILFPPAKINLGLNILGKREDGYHDIESCMYAIPLRDVLEILPSEEVRFLQTGMPVNGDEADNLVMKAFQLLQSRYAIPNVYIHLQKNIPMGAGLGGGSADATYTLLGLNELFKLNLSIEVLQSLATELGSDCPFFVVNQPQLVKGRGEVLSPINLDLEGYYLKIINPGIHIGTAEAYSNVEYAEVAGSLETILLKSPEYWKNNLINGFEKSVFKKYPQIRELKEQLYAEGALYASMTGSGSTVFGIFKNFPESSDKEPFAFVCCLD